MTTVILYLLKTKILLNRAQYTTVLIDPLHPVILIFDLFQIADTAQSFHIQSDLSIFFEDDMPGADLFIILNIAVINPDIL